MMVVKIVALILIIAVSSTHQQYDYGGSDDGGEDDGFVLNTKESCSAPPIRAQQKEFQFRSSLLQLFPRVPIFCNGYLTKWAFISRNQNGTGMYLSVWRRANTTAARPDIFKQIGVTRIDNFTATRDVWTEYEVPNPFPVRSGDILGIYYQMWQVLWPYSGHIPVTPTFATAPKGLDQYYGDAIVMNHDAVTLAEEFATRKTNIVDMTGAATVPRFPAIQAIVDANVGVPATTRSTPKPATKPPPPGTRPPPTEPPQERDPRRCLSPFRTQGRCDYNKVTLRWFFDTSTKLCEMFWHYDCVVSQNIFVGRESCDYHCAELISGALDASSLNNNNNNKPPPSNNNNNNEIPSYYDYDTVQSKKGLRSPSSSAAVNNNNNRRPSSPTKNKNNVPWRK